MAEATTPTPTVLSAAAGGKPPAKAAKEAKESKLEPSSLEALLEKRLANFDYLKRVHQGSALWMNTLQLTKEDLARFYLHKTQRKKTLTSLTSNGPLSISPSAASSFSSSSSSHAPTNTNDTFLQKRSESWFYMGISLAPLITVDTAETFLHAFLTFWEEYEDWTEKGGPDQEIPSGAAGTNYSGKKTPRKRSKREYLTTPNIPSTLDYLEIVYSLFDLLVHLYKKLLSLCATLTTTQIKTAFKIDARIKNHVLTTVSKELEKLALATLDEQMASVGNLFSSGLIVLGGGHHLLED
ncbi:hypothetical protein QOT17_000384 [Balamuthia mandrillaris]